ncbi:MAG: SIS domain-containing protein [Saccharospirillaceae bacterium]|nr:SIS domain-containing protein [Pseudomonadales bacterium]NRB80116.1 SIS domain-containing protein [Saccharospirillaceae bacterium]
MSQQALVIQHFEQNIQTSMYAQDMLVRQIEQVGQLCTRVLLSNSNRLFTCGMQLSELVGQYLSSALLKREAGMKPALPSINLNINSFMQMGSDTQSQGEALRAFAQENDVLIVFALDGDDLSINDTVKVAKELGLTVVVVLGQQGQRINEILTDQDVEIRIPADDDASVIEHQILVSNTFIKLIDNELFGF